MNGVIGLDPALRLDRWRLQVKNLANAQSSPHYVAGREYMEVRG